MDAIPSADLEKAKMVIQLDHSQSDREQYVQTALDEKQQMKIMFVALSQQISFHPADFMSRRKIDYRMLPILGLMYSISLIDRTNLGLALVAGMQKDLGLAIGNRYTVVVMIFFVAYMYVRQYHVLSRI